MKKSQEEFVVGKHNIGWLDSDFKPRFPDVEFEPRTLGTFKVLPKGMTTIDILKEELATECELGDVLAFLENPPEGSKDGYYNLFIIKNSSFVVFVGWSSDSERWDVDTWDRDVCWLADGRVFSPATASSTLSPSPKPFESLDLLSSFSDFIDEEYPKGDKDRGTAMLYVAQFVVWLNKKNK